MTHRVRSLVPLAPLVALALLARASTLGAQPPAPSPMRALTLEATPLFLAESVGNSGTIPLQVSLTNHTGRDLRGELLLEPMGWRERDVPQRIRVDVPARQRRLLRVTQQVSYSAERLQLTYTPVGLPPQRSEVPLLFRGGSLPSTVIVLANPPRMRSHLYTRTSAAASAASGTPYPRSLNAVGEVAFAPESGDALVPDDAAAWSSYPVIFATIEDADKLEGAARRALLGHVQAGARIVLVPRRAEDCSAAIVRELMGDVRCTPRGEQPPPEGLSDQAWARALRLQIQGDAGTLPEEFGLSRPRGFGTAFLLAWDANAADADPIATQEVLAGMELHVSRNVGPHHVHGAVPDDATSLRAALDPNEAFRPTLGAVAILLLLYVFAVGPLNFRYVERRGRPTLALLTTPAIALGCFVLMAGAAYLSKGVRMRSRVIDVVELPSDSALGLRSRYVGYYLTRPRTFDVQPAEGVRAMLLDTDGGGRTPVSELRGGAQALIGLRGGLWETLVTQEQSVLDTRGELRVAITHDDPAHASITNRGSATLRGALYMNPAGEIFVLGDIPPGETRQQPPSVHATLYDWELRTGRGSSYDIDQATLAMGLSRSDASVVRAAMSVIREGVSREGVWARVEAAPEGVGVDGFAAEWEHRFVFVAATRDAGVPLILPPTQETP